MICAAASSPEPEPTPEPEPQPLVLVSLGRVSFEECSQGDNEASDCLPKNSTGGALLVVPLFRDLGSGSSGPTHAHEILNVIDSDANAVQPTYGAAGTCCCCCCCRRRCRCHCWSCSSCCL
eukprot:COSAG05_NODE_465_length_9537_cov_21.527086_15_plen_121_part_00